MMNLAEVNWDLEAAGTWPLPLKIAAVILVCLLTAAAWIYFSTQHQLGELEQAEKKEQELKKTFEIRQGKIAHLEEYKQQLIDMEKSFGDMLRQLPDRTEVPELLVDVSQTGLASGLEFELFQPQGEITKEFYAELPINVRVVGNFEEFGRFVSGLASLPRIVTVHNVSIAPRNKEKETLVMQSVVKTYRYLDDESSPAAKDKKRGRK